MSETFANLTSFKINVTDLSEGTESKRPLFSLRIYDSKSKEIFTSFS